MAEKERLKKVVIVNKYGPFDKDITGKSLWQLGSYLSLHNCDVSYVCVQKSNKSNAPQQADDNTAHIRYVPVFNLGKGSVGRLLSSVLECKLLFWRTLFVKADVLIVMTAPPMMNLWGVWLKRLKKSRVIFWTMDLYPDAFVASGLGNPNSKFYRYLERIIYTNTPDALISLGPQQTKLLQSKYKINAPTFILPCGIKQVMPSITKPTWINTADADKIKFCYAGNIGEAHDERFLIALAKNLDPQKHRLYINVYGNKADVVKNAIKDLTVVQMIDFLSYDQMHFLDIHIVSLLQQWDHVCVPSKAVSAICASSVLLLNSSNQCDAWQMFHDACFWVPQENHDYTDAIKNVLSQINLSVIQQKSATAKLISNELKQLEVKAFQKTSDFIQLS